MPDPTGDRPRETPLGSIERHVTCKDFASFILEYLENELDGTTRATFEQHLSICPNCLRYLAKYRATIVAARTVFQGPPGMLPPGARGFSCARSSCHAVTEL